MKLSVERKIIGGFGVALLLLGLSSGFALWNATRFTQAAKQAAQTQQILTELEVLMSELKDAETGQRGYIITSKDAYLEPYYVAVGRVDTHIDKLEQLLLDSPSQRQRLDQIKPLTAQKMAELRETIALRQEQGFDAALRVVNSDKGKQLMDQIRQSVQEMQGTERQQLRQHTDQTATNAQVLKLVVVGSGLIAIAIVPLAILLINRDINKRKQAEQSLQQSEAALQQANQRLIGWVDELEQRNQTMLLFNQLNDLFQACFTIEEACTAIVQIMPQLFPHFSGSIFLINASRNLAEVAANWGNSLHSQTLFAPDECLALRRGQPHLLQQTSGNLRCTHIQPSLPGDSFCVPMLAQGETLGVLYLDSPEPGMLTEVQRNIAIAIAKQISLALANLKLRETLQAQSIRDPLTGLYNRRYMEEFLSRELHRAQRNQQPVGLIMVDVDHFKLFNDTFGHEAGDAVLRELGLFLRSQIRSSDVACRYGGEELTLILPEASLEDTYRRAEKLREGVKHLHVQHRRQLVGEISISLGVACFPEHGTTGESILQAADAALYRAKSEGRDRVVTAH